MVKLELRSHYNLVIVGDISVVGVVPCVEERPLLTRVQYADNRISTDEGQTFHPTVWLESALTVGLGGVLPPTVWLESALTAGLGTDVVRLNALKPLYKFQLT